MYFKHHKSYLLVAFVFLFFTSVLNLQAQNSSKKQFVVVIDAGHGGHDPGNRGSGYYEKHIALDVALAVGKELEKHQDIKVIYTRKTDVFIPLHKRAQIANDAKADLFVSIHCNAHGSSAHGTETFVLGLHNSKANLEIAMKENSVIYLEEDYEVTYGGFDPNDKSSYIGMTLMQEEYLDQSILLADFIQKEYTNKLKRVNRGVKQAGLLVLRETVMPSVLTEIGFLSYKPEGSYLNSSKGKSDVAKSIENGILNYKKSLNLNLFNTPIEINEASSSQNNKKEYTDNYDDITFKVQVAAGSTAIETNPYNFKGLQNISREKEGKYYKYYYGATSSYKEVQNFLEEAKKAGYENSYIVAFKDEKKISVNDALKTKKD
ncbi:N-acetylmuramoyl-L-alanine amidase [Mesonia sp. K7]|uniref:N-acetylmuramoyl-L-alanine amidase family protein n=1 Tax=Mesonia sp. K7 TaxID=2218606 RepID=UPI000DA9A736|nr:N-acetylmuramoyl-L-alanine amidase [Mesonia sp. K7]PZD76474.1 N-acetylmuramoyl-L-alanine amidase [Mesonia sp. K7]